MYNRHNSKHVLSSHTVGTWWHILISLILRPVDCYNFKKLFWNKPNNVAMRFVNTSHVKVNCPLIGAPIFVSIHRCHPSELNQKIKAYIF